MKIMLNLQVHMLIKPLIKNTDNRDDKLIINHADKCREKNKTANKNAEPNAGKNADTHTYEKGW